MRRARRGIKAERNSDKMAQSPEKQGKKGEWEEDCSCARKFEAEERRIVTRIVARRKNGRE